MALPGPHGPMHMRYSLAKWPESRLQTHHIHGTLSPHHHQHNYEYDDYNTVITIFEFKAEATCSHVPNQVGIQHELSSK